MELARKGKKEGPIFTVVVPVRNRGGARLRNCIKSISLQSMQPLEIIIADYGSSSEGHADIMETVEPFDCTVYYYPTDKVWSLALARNIGIRRANGYYVVVVDADLILEHEVVETLLLAHQSDSNSYISCFIRMLKSSILQEIEFPAPRRPGPPGPLPDAFAQLKEIDFWPSAGWGGLVSATKSWYFKVRGFDERMKFWGAEDSDLWKRAGLDGMNRLRINDFNLPDTGVYHQWHDDCLSWDQSKLSKEQQQQITWNKMIRAKDFTVIRNNEKWGLWEPAKPEDDQFFFD